MWGARAIQGPGSVTGPAETVELHGKESSGWKKIPPKPTASPGDRGRFPPFPEDICIGWGSRLHTATIQGGQEIRV